MSLERAIDGHLAMARDVLLLNSAEAGVPGVRVYTWDGVWVSLGHHQNPSDALKDSATRWVTRPTGGSAVLHGHDITVSIAMPLAHVVRAYPVVTSPLIAALSDQGIDTHHAESRADDHSSPDCFGSRGKNDLIDPMTGTKLVGCAVRRTRKAVLLQASIPISAPLVPASDVLIGGVEPAIVSVDPEHLLDSVLRRVV